MNERENRQSARSRALLGGLIVHNSGHSVLNCLVRDISETGARLKVENALTVPETFELRLNDGRIFKCTVRWRQLALLGVSFS